MQVDEKTGLRAERDGQTYFFCCDHCRRKFLKQPLPGLSQAGLAFTQPDWLKRPGAAEPRPSDKVARASSPASSGGSPHDAGQLLCCSDCPPLEGPGGTPVELAAGTAALHFVNGRGTDLLHPLTGEVC